MEKKKTFTFNQKEKTITYLACIPGISILIYFIEEDKYIKYLAAQYTVILAIPLVVGFPTLILALIMALIPCIGVIFMLLGIFIILLIGIGFITTVIYGFIKTSKEEIIHLPVLSDLTSNLIEKL